MKTPTHDGSARRRRGGKVTSARSLGNAFLLALVVLGTACGMPDNSTGAAPTGAPAAAPTATPGHQLRVALVATQLAVGTYRFPVGVSDHNTPVSDATVHVGVASVVNGVQTPK